jgi:rhodanese-related sulfurtransferase
LKQLGIEYGSSTTHSASHAGYYPDALPLTIKLTFDPVSGKLYGGQSVGYGGVDKRIDQIALLIKHGGTVFDLVMTEHTYAPPFSSAKDPVAIAGYVAGNIVSGVMPIITWRQLQETDTSHTLLLDVRTPGEHASGAISNSVNIPLDELRSRLDELPRDKMIYIYCAVGLRGYLAMKILKARGFNNVKNLSGGYKTYALATAPV